jgi:cytochrome P450
MSPDSVCPVAPENFTVANPAFINDPFKDYDWMVEQPVWRDPATNFWVVTRYEEVRAVALDPATWSNRASQIFNRTSTVAAQVKEMYETRGWLPMDTVVSNDPPEHKFYRALIDKALTPARVKTIIPQIEAKVDELTDAMLQAGKLDFISKFAVPLTMTMLASQVGGAGPEDIDFIRHKTDLQMEAIDPLLSPERELLITEEVIEFQHYLARAIERLRIAPTDTILSTLVHADVDGRKLTVQEIIAVATLFFGAGHDTTTSALGSSMRYLAENPDALKLLKEQPDKINNFVEEMLRLEAPIQRLFRRATKDTEIGGVTIRENEIALIQWGGANRDPARFGCPHLMDVARTDSNRHLTFGAGIHLCVGNQLARAELRAAIAAITSRCATIALANGADSYRYHPLFIARSLARLDVVVT